MKYFKGDVIELIAKVDPMTGERSYQDGFGGISRGDRYFVKEDRGTRVKLELPGVRWAEKKDFTINKNVLFLYHRPFKNKVLSLLG